jgi:hypothetical protein
MPKRRRQISFNKLLWEFYYSFDNMIWEKYQMNKTISAIAILKLGSLDIIIGTNNLFEGNNLYYRMEDLI